MSDETVTRGGTTYHQQGSGNGKPDDTRPPQQQAAKPPQPSNSQKPPQQSQPSGNQQPQPEQGSKRTPKTSAGAAVGNRQKTEVKDGTFHMDGKDTGLPVEHVKVLAKIIFFLTYPLRWLYLLLRPPWSSILFGLVGLFLFALNVEQIYCNFPERDALKFIPKVGINDGASIGNLLIVVTLDSFVLILSMLLSAALTAIEAWTLAASMRSVDEMLRDIDQAIALNEIADNARDRSGRNASRLVKRRIREVERYARQPQGADDAVVGTIAVTAWIIELSLANGSYDLLGAIGEVFAFGVGRDNLFAAFVWALLGTFGTEWMLRPFMASWRRFKDIPGIFDFSNNSRRQKQ